MRKSWTKQEVQYLKDNWPAKSECEIAAELQRSLCSVQNMRYKLGLRIDPAEWSREEDLYIQENWNVLTDKEIAHSLKRTAHEIYMRGISLGLMRRSPSPKGHRPWTEKEISYLSEKWGMMPVENIARILNRSVNAIITKRSKLGLQAFKDCGDYITFNQFLITFDGSNGSYSSKLESWVSKRGLPLHTKKVNNQQLRIIYIEEFWPWAEKNRSFINFSRLEPLALGEEPDWVAAQRRKDYYSPAIQRKTPWTSAEDSRLVYLLKQQKYSYAELSDILHRSAGGIQSRCIELGLKERPIRAANLEWTTDDFRILADGIRNGDSYLDIAHVIGRSEKAVRGRVFNVYLTENADKVRQLMGNGPWGAGAPVPTVKQGLKLSRTKAKTMHCLALLDRLLRQRIDKLNHHHLF